MQDMAATVASCSDMVAASGAHGDGTRRVTEVMTGRAVRSALAALRSAGCSGGSIHTSGGPWRTALETGRIDCAPVTRLPLRRRRVTGDTGTATVIFAQMKRYLTYVHTPWRGF